MSSSYNLVFIFNLLDQWLFLTYFCDWICCISNAVEKENDWDAVKIDKVHFLLSTFESKSLFSAAYNQKWMGSDREQRNFQKLLTFSTLFLFTWHFDHSLSEVIICFNFFLHCSLKLKTNEIRIHYIIKTWVNILNNHYKFSYRKNQ